MARLKRDMELRDVIILLTTGGDGSINPGAMQSLIVVNAAYPVLFPEGDADFSVMFSALDKNELYGTDIYVLFNDKCCLDPRSMLLLLLGVDFGVLPKEKLVEMAKDQMREVNLTVEEWIDLDKKVSEILPTFMGKAEWDLRKSQPPLT